MRYAFGASTILFAALLACSKHDAASTDAGAANPAVPPVLDAQALSSPEPTHPLEPLILRGAPENVAAGLKPRILHCYAIGLHKDPTMHGDLTITANLSPNGEVSTVDTKELAGLSTFVARCITRLFKNSQLTPPGSGPPTVEVSMTLTPGMVKSP